MATQQQVNGRQARPITSHPLFPAVVALWFGALFGVGSLAVRGGLIEDLVIASRIDLLVPAAAPPLGLTARLLLALGLAAFGAMLGAWLGRKLGEVTPAKRQRRRDAASVQPQSADADQSLEQIEAAAVQGRRRALALEEAEPAFEVGEPAPLPGGAPQIFVVAETGIAPIDAGAIEPEPFEPLELATLAPAPEQPAASGPVAGACPPAERQIFRPAPPAPVTEPAPAHVEAVAAPSLPERDEPIGAPVSAFAVPQAAPLFPAREAAVVAAKAPPPPPPAPIDPDAPLQNLAARLASAMERRRAARGFSASSSLAPPTAMADDDLILPSLLPPRLSPAQRAEVEARLRPAEPIAVPSTPLALPETMRRLVPEALAGEDETAPSFESLLPPRKLSIPPVAPLAAALADEADEGEDQASGTDDRFSSLLALAPRGEAVRSPFVRIEEPPAPGGIEPVVVFPGQLAGSLPTRPLPRIAEERPFDPPQHAGAKIAPPEAGAPRDQDETERALKLALASLQRMSGAA